MTTVKFYTDSKIVLGYIYNTSRRFYVYVANRVARIRSSTKPEQWHHISSELNPADLGTRFVPANILPHTNWFCGPEFLCKPDLGAKEDSFDLVEPGKDQEIRTQVTTMVTNVTDQSLGSHRFKRFSEWTSLVRSIANLIHIVQSFSDKKCTLDCKGWHLCQKSHQVDWTQAKTVIIQCVQQEHYSEELKKLRKREEISQQSSLKKLAPFVDGDGLIRVGGRLQLAELSEQEKHPLVIPACQHVSTLLVRHYHERVAHQGGAYGALWSIMSRRTRGGSAESKRWAVIFSCLSTRAVHLEVIESMSTSSFINALRRFLAVRGPVKHLRSDRGTNFIGACRELNIKTDDPELKGYLQEQGCTWSFNVPHSSHMGGAWERMINTARCILDGLLLKSSCTRLTY